MSQGTGIEWTDATWNPVSGCTRVSAGCDHCYAVRATHRLEAMGQAKYAGLTVLNPRGERHFNGVVRCHEEALSIPLGWRKPRRVFVNSMSDLFHKEVPFEFVDGVFAIMALCQQHTFQVLTKRPERMVEYLTTRGNWQWAEAISRLRKTQAWVPRAAAFRQGPLPNVWLGTSVENQEAADERIPHLLRCPAAVRFLSCEPLLGAIDLESIADDVHNSINALTGNRLVNDACRDGPSVDWVIVGGESGKGARPCDVAWIGGIVGQCKAAGVPVFVKQLGACFFDAPNGIAGRSLEIAPEGMALLSCRLGDSKGGDMAEWPEDLRLREMPPMESEAHS